MGKVIKPDFKSLFNAVRQKIIAARFIAAKNINTIQVLTNFEIGRLIVEHEQLGKKRAGYGKETIKELSRRLSYEFGRGFSSSNLEYMRKFYLLYQDRSPRILPRLAAISQMPSGELNIPAFSLSWSQYVFLLGIKEAAARSFYEIEAANNNWTLPELNRQFNSGLYERLALSRDKEGVRKLAKEGQVISKQEDLLKEPYVLEFLGIDEKEKYSESDLESAIIDKIEEFEMLSVLFRSADYMAGKYVVALNKMEREGTWKNPRGRINVTSRNISQPYVTLSNINKEGGLV